MSKILKIYTRIILLVFPFFFLPIIYDAFGLGKSSFLLLSGGVGMILWVADLLFNKKDEVRYSKWMWWLVILLIWSMVSFFKMTLGSQARSISSPLGVGGLVGLMFWFFLWLQVRDKDEYQKQLNFLSISAILVGLLSVVAFLIPESRLPFSWPRNNPWVVINNGWSVTGSVLTELVFLLLVAVEWLKKLLTKLKAKVDIGGYFVEAITTAFFGLLVFLDGYKLIKLGWNYLDGRSAWAIAAETLKNSPFFGVGLGNFIEAFSQFRPASFNMTNMWASTFGVSLMGILNWWTELGTVGLVIIIIMLIMGWRKRKENQFIKVGFLSLGVLLLPPSLMTVFLLFWVMANDWGEIKESKLILPLGEKKVNVMPYLVSILLLGLVGFCGYKMTRSVLADYYYKLSLVATSKNDGAGAYNNQIKAISFNPNLADYRANYSQTNLALANNFLNVKSGETITEENKQKASTLIQQAVREAQAAVSLDNKIAAYWSNLGSIYQALIGLVDGSLNWSIQSYQQAALLDPVNPMVNMQLGSLYYGSNDYVSAERLFEEALLDKSDMANGWYNWAYAAKQQNKLQLAVNRLEKAVTLVKADSSDYEKASKELETWKKELEEAIKKYNQQVQQQQDALREKTPETLTTPQPLPTKGNEEKVNVSKEELEPKMTVTPTETKTE